MTDKVKSRGKRGPEPERLKIEGDPQEALRKLLTVAPRAKPEKRRRKKSTTARRKP